MFRKFFHAPLVALVATVVAAFAPAASRAADVALTPVTEPAVPEKGGLAGMAAGAFHDASGRTVVLAAGGANFPAGLPWEGGAKVFHSAVYRLSGDKWEKVGDLPKPVAYAAYAATPKGLVVAGGCDAAEHFADVSLVTAEGGVTALPALPRPVAYAAFAVENNRLYIIGGQESPAATTAINATYRLDLTKLDSKKPGALAWETLPGAPFGGRILSTAGALDGRIQVFGGCSLAAGPDGNPARTYHADGATLVTTAHDAKNLWATDRPAPMPTPLAGAATPAAAREGLLFFIGGDDGSHYGKPPQAHPGQSKSVLTYEPRTREWTRRAEWPEGIATAPALIADDLMMTVSGETKPGVRTPGVYAIDVGYALRLHTIDWVVFALGALAVAAIVWQALTKGVSRALADTAKAAGKPGRIAWIAVGLLFMVAMLNYLDRQLLATMRPPIVRDIPQTDAQFGMLTAIFLFIYSALSPVGGILADRFSRRIVILVSLIVWSAVTWLTGHVRTYEELMWARALMGVSEACYIPAALALITDFHRGPTRSLATGIHMSGIYLGQALAGVGGFVAQSVGWRLTFGVFGLVGVGYALVLILFLKEPGAKAAGAAVSVETLPPVAEKKPGILEILSGVLRIPAFWLLMAIMACASVSNWFILSWLPLLLQEKFNLSLGEAGTLATTPSSIAKYVAVIGGALLADAWSRRNAKGRSLLAGIGFVVAGPMVALCLGVNSLPLFIGCVLFQGLAQGLLDATLMPVLRSHIDGRFAATGYGFLNLVGAGLGGVAVVYGGKLRDAGIPLATTLACSGAGLVVCGVALLLLPKPKIEG